MTQFAILIFLRLCKVTICLMRLKSHVFGDLLFLFLDGGKVSCLRLATGEVLWKHSYATKAVTLRKMTPSSYCFGIKCGALKD